MDPAGSGTLVDVLQAQASKIQDQDQQISTLRHELKEMTSHQEFLLAGFGNQLNSLMDQMRGLHSPVALSTEAASSLGAAAEPAAPVVLSTPAPLPLHLSRPERFSGDSGDCKTFLTQCDLHFELQAAALPTDRSKIAYIISHLMGRAETWATAEWSRGSPVCSSLPAFTTSLTQIFQNIVPGREAARALVRLRQGKRHVSDYAIEFRILAAESDWNEAALYDAFLDGLLDPLKDYLVPVDLPADLDSLIALAVKIDKRLCERRKGYYCAPTSPPLHWGQRSGRSSSSSAPWRALSPEGPPPAPPSVHEEPMQLGRTQPDGGGAMFILWTSWPFHRCLPPEECWPS